MDNKTNWTENLVLAGFLPQAINEGLYLLQNETEPNIRFLKDIFASLAIDTFIGRYFDYCEACNWKDDTRQTINPFEFVVSAREETISRDSWIESLKRVGGRTCELICKPDKLELRILDVPLLSIVRQLNRLGLFTCYSCTGHDKREPEIHFNQEEHANKARHIFNQFGFIAKKRIRRVVLSNAVDFFELGLFLSKLSHLEEEEIISVARSIREKFIEELLMIPGTSGEEARVREYILHILKSLTDHLHVDNYGNLLALKQNGSGPTILLSAHMDVVSRISEKSKIVKNGTLWRRDNGILGADDRAGVALIISLLRSLNSTDFRGTLKLAFTVEEEIGQLGAQNIDPTFYWGVDCAISLDRRDGSDIVRNSKLWEYGSIEYSAIFEKVSKGLWGGQYPYRAVSGGVSDLRVWSSEGINSVNLSVGFRNEHTTEELLDLSIWHRTFELMTEVLPELRFWKRKNHHPRNPMISTRNRPLPLKGDSRNAI